MTIQKGTVPDVGDQIPGMSRQPRAAPNSRRLARGALQALLKDGLSATLRMRLHTRYGEVRWIESLVHAVHDEDSAISGADQGIIGAVMASRDITELREREEQLEVAGLAVDPWATR